MSRARQLAATAFRRAIALDSSITRTAPQRRAVDASLPDLGHRTATPRRARLSSPVPAADSGPGSFAWRAAWLFHDSAATNAMHARFAEGSVNGLEGVVTRSIEDGLPLDDAERAVASLVSARNHAAGAVRAQFVSLHGGDERRAPHEGVSCASGHQPTVTSTMGSRASSTGTANGVRTRDRPSRADARGRAAEGGRRGS